MVKRNTALTPAGAKPKGREAIWLKIREVRTFTITKLALDVSQERATVRTYVDSLVKGGYLAASGEELAPSGMFGVAPNQRAVLYHLVKDVGVEAPKVNVDGSPSTRGNVREQMWRTMRLIRSDFTAHELAIAATTEATIVTDGDAHDYIRDIARAGYLIDAGKAPGSNRKRYRFVAARYSGPKPPIVTSLKTVFDPNLGKVVWQAEVDA